MILTLGLTSCLQIKKITPSNDKILFCETLLKLTNRYSIEDQLQLRDLSEKAQKEISLTRLEILDECNPQ